MGKERRIRLCGARRLLHERLERRLALDGAPLISEFMASNGGTLLDEDGDASDWIEVHNPSESALDLGGWHLTDDEGELSRWAFPDVTLEPGGYLVVFASGKDRADASGALHTDFRLAVEGEYLGLVEPDGRTIAHAFAPEFPPQARDVSYGLDDSGEPSFFSSPTPGSPNGPGQSPAARVVINEVMYHPSSQSDADEYIELYNPGTAAVSLFNWRIADGVAFTFGNVTIAAGGYVVVAADPAALAANYPTTTNVVGGWEGRLSNSGETIRLEDAAGVGVDQITYADEGDWSARERGPLEYGHEGWVWSDAHDGLGSSLELVAATLPNDVGHNWLASAVPGGTPGGVNSVARADAAPLIVDAAHSPIIPRASDPVTITARVFDEQPAGATVSVHYRIDGEPGFTAVAMHDDGRSGDGAAGDATYGATIPAHADKSVIEFYMEATDDAGNRSTAPRASQPSGEQLTNYLYQVDDTFDPEAGWSPGDMPVYRLIMTDAERAELEQIGSNPSEGRSHARMNGTLVSVDESGVQFRYNAGIRNRGRSSRARLPNSYHIDIPTDRAWGGVHAFNLNTQSTHLQQLGTQAFQAAGLVSEDTRPVGVRVNGVNLSMDEAPAFGVYIHLEAADSRFASNHFPGDDGGNLYRVVRGAGNAAFGDLRVLEDEADYRIYYEKKTNTAADDYADLSELVDVLNNSPDEVYVDALRNVADIDQWLGYFAVNAILNNKETSLSSGVGDDYLLYRGIDDPRFVLIPHDFDSILGQGVSGEPTEGIYRAASNPVIERFLLHPQILPQYHATLERLLETTFSRHTFNGLVDQHIGAFSPQGRIDSLKAFMDTRREFILEEIAAPLTAASPLALSGGYYYTSQDVALVVGTAPLAGTRSVTVNGKPADYDPTTGVWHAGEAGDPANAGVALLPGVNRVVVEAFDGPGGAGRLLDTTSIDVWYDDGTLHEVAGEITEDTLWRAAAGPLHVTGSVNVAAGATLTIEAGTTVFFDPGTALKAAGGRILAEGTPHRRIRFAALPSSGQGWGGLALVDAPLESRFRYVDFEGGDGQGAAATVDHAAALFDRVSWSDVNEIVLDAVHPTLTVLDSVFPPVSGDETVHLSGLDQGEEFVFEGNVFGMNTSGGDVFDAGHNTLDPPTIYFRNNVFLGGLDDGLDTDGFPAVLEGNTFMNFHDGSSRQTTSNAVSTGHATVGGQIVPSRLTLRNNIFFDVDHALLLKDGSFAELTNNTIVGAARAAIQFDEVDGSNVVGPGRGATIDGVIFWDVAETFKHLTSETELTVDRSIGPAVLGGLGTGNLAADPLLVDPAAGDFRPRPDSPAIAAGPGGTDIGAVQVERGSMLRISELHYHPHDPRVESGELNVDADQFEFIELVNTSTAEAIDMSGIRFASGIEFDFTTSPVQELGPGERVLVVRNAAAFQSRYGSGYRIAGEFAGGTALSNGGESIRLENAVGGTIVDFAYSDGDPWPAEADGPGRSLVVVRTDGDYNSPTNWQASAEVGGSPGAAEPVDEVLQGDYNGNGIVEQADLDLVLRNWGSDASAPPDGWINELPGGPIDQQELDAVLLNWGRSSKSGGE